jgi:Domain of Unknown Function (DUF1259)
VTATAAAENSRLGGDPREPKQTVSSRIIRRPVINKWWQRGHLSKCTLSELPIGKQTVMAMSIKLATACALMMVVSCGWAASSTTVWDTSSIEQLTGAKGTYNEKEKVFKVSMPRADLHLTIDGVKMNPALGLTSWAAFTQTADGVMVMGDTVLLESQVGPVMTTALENGLEVTALHNHFFYDSPKIMFMHIGGHGDQQKLARGVGAVFAKIKDTSVANSPRATADIDPAKTNLDPNKIESIVGAKGDLKDGVLKFTFGRTSHMHGNEVGNAMGVNTWAAFAGSDAQAVVDGDFVVLESELQPVLLALRHADIEVVAIHNHMTHEEPRMIFLHYWGIGPTEKLAHGLKAALSQTKTL